MFRGNMDDEHERTGDKKYKRWREEEIARSLQESLGSLSPRILTHKKQASREGGFDRGR